MAVKTPKDLEQLQRKMGEEFDRFLASRSGARPAPQPDDLPALVAEARTSLDAAIREREEGLRIADQRIERKKVELAALEASLERAKQKAVKKPAKGKKHAEEEP